MRSSIVRWWKGLSSRERVLIGVAGAIALPLFLIYALWLPLAGVVETARADHGVAVDRHAAILDRVEAIRTAEAARGNTAVAAAGDVAQLVAQSAAAAGLTLAQNEASGTARTRVAIANARAIVVLPWLDALERAGLTLEEVTMRPNPDGTVATTLVARRGA